MTAVPLTRWASPFTSAHSTELSLLKETSPASLLQDLSRLRFGEVKVRALRGALSHLVDDAEGAPSYLREIRQACGEFAAAPNC